MGLGLEGKIGKKNAKRQAIQLPASIRTIGSDNQEKHFIMFFFSSVGGVGWMDKGGRQLWQKQFNNAHVLSVYDQNQTFPSIQKQVSWDKD